MERHEEEEEEEYEKRTGARMLDHGNYPGTRGIAASTRRRVEKEHGRRWPLDTGVALWGIRSPARMGRIRVVRAVVAEEEASGEIVAVRVAVVPVVAAVAV